MDTLTTQQRNAVVADGLCVLSACPGSGKTFVVTKRIEHILQSKPLKKYQGILALSFTNTAKQEILKGYYKLTGRHLDSPHFVGTIDSFLNQRIFLPLGHKVMKSKKAIVLNPHCSDFLFERFPELRAIKGDLEYLPNGDLLCKTSDDDVRRRMKSIKQRMMESGLATQSDVNYWSMKILEEYPQITANIIKRFPYMIIDEAQDCSAIQTRIIDILKEHGMSQIMLVGDPYQAIYEFRNAEPALFIQKIQDPEWRHLDLTRSFRSGSNICTLISRLHPEKNIIPSPDITDDEVVFKHGTREELIEDFVQAAGDKGIAIEKEKVAILYSSHSSDISAKKTTTKVDGVFALDNRNFSCLPLHAAIMLASEKRAEAMRFLEKLFYYLIHDDFLGSESDLQESVLSEVRNKVRISKFAQHIPPLTLKLDEWTEQINKLIASECAFFGVDAKKVIPLKRRTSKQKELFNSSCLWEIFLNQPLTTHDALMTNIHQIKGRTFDAVMLYLEPGAAKDMSVGKILKMRQSLQSEGSTIFFKPGKNSEKYRCYYVAISRPKKLLWIASSDEKVLELGADTSQPSCLPLIFAP